MEFIILSVKGDATAVRYVFVFVTFVFVIASIIDLTVSYNKSKINKKKWNFPRWYIYPFLFWVAFFIFDVFSQSKLRKFNEINAKNNNSSFEKKIKSEPLELKASDHSQTTKDVVECEWCWKEIHGHPYSAKFKDTYGTASRISESYFCNDECYRKYVVQNAVYH